MVETSPQTTIFEGVTLNDLEVVAQKIILLGKEISCWIFVGEVGTGKTTLIKKIAQIQGISDNVSSPTFSIVNEYLDHNAHVTYHFDFYRVNDLQEVLDIGFDEYLQSGRRCWIEWPEIAQDLLPDQYCKISIIHASPESRNIEVVLN